MSNLPILVEKIKNISQFLQQNHDSLLKYHRASRYLHLPPLKIDGIPYLDSNLCPICQESMGKGFLYEVRLNLKEQTVVFPSNYYHYLEKHEVLPSTVLIESIMSLHPSDYNMTPISDELDRQFHFLEISEGMKNLQL